MTGSCFWERQIGLLFTTNRSGVDTSSALTQNPDILKAVLPTIPMGWIARSEERAGAVLYLVSDAASYTTGICLPVDDGMPA